MMQYLQLICHIYQPCHVARRPRVGGPVCVRLQVGYLQPAGQTGTAASAVSAHMHNQAKPLRRLHQEPPYPRNLTGAHLQVRLRVQLAEHVQAAGHADVAASAVAAHEHPHAQRLRRLRRLLRLLKRRLLDFPLFFMCLTQARYHFSSVRVWLVHPPPSSVLRGLVRAD